MTETFELKESPLRSVFKAISYRVVGTLTTGLLVWYVTGDVHIAVTMGALEPVVKMVVYYAHERAWQQVPRGTVRRLAHWQR